MVDAEDPLPEGDWPVSFEGVRLAQHLRFRAMTPRQKIQAMEDMAEFIAHMRRMRERAKAKPKSEQL